MLATTTAVTAIGGRARGTQQQRRGAAPAPAVTVTFEIRLTGDGLPRGASRLLEVVRELAGELGEGAVRVVPPISRRAAAEPSPERRAPTAGVTGRPTPDRTAPVIGLDTVRAQQPPPGAAQDGVLYVDPTSRTVVRDGQAQRLTRLEFDLLLFLGENPDRAFRRAELLRGVWGYDQTSARTVDVHIRRLRVKLGVHRPLVTTVHGVGYRLDERARVSVLRG